MKKYLLIIIISIAAVLRLWQLGSVPPSPDWDETSLGYNAYSIMLTGKDEYGESLPLILRSFDDYKPGLYAYLVIPFIKLFGLEVFSVRLPSVIFGILTVLAAYFLVNELFKRRDIAILSSFLLAISPWHIQFSRVAFESNVGVAFNVFTILFFLKGLNSPRLLLLAVFFAGLNIHMYQGEKVFTPLLVLGLLIIFRKKILEIPRRFILGSAFIGFLLILPLIWYTFTQEQVFLRARGVSVFSDQTPFLSRTVERLQRDLEQNDILGLVLDNRRIIYAISFINGYLSHFDINWLFITGDEARHHAPNMGLLYLFELPFLFIGIYSLIFGKFDKKAKLAIFLWFLIAPIPAAITTGVPHAVRTLNFLPTWQIFTAFGILTTLAKVLGIKHNVLSIKSGLLLVTCYLLLVTFNFSYYLNQYFVQQNYFNSQFWQYGYKEAVEEVKKLEPKYDKIVVSNRPHLDQSYMFFLFYLKYDPVKYQAEGGTVSGGFAEPHRGFSKYTFRPIEWDKEERNQRILFVGRSSDFPENTKVIKIIHFLNGETAIKIVEG